MNTDQFNQLTLPEQVILIPIKGRFIAERQVKNQLVKLYHCDDTFLEIYYRRPVSQRRGADWEPFRVNDFANESGCSDQLFPYVDQISLDDLFAWHKLFQGWSVNVC